MADPVREALERLAAEIEGADFPWQREVLVERIRALAAPPSPGEARAEPLTAAQEAIMDQRPSIGRIVLYQRHGSPNGQHKSEPSPAVITAVRADIGKEGSTGPGLDGYVDLCVFNPSGVYFDRATPYDPEGEQGGTWRWPPRV